MRTLSHRRRRGQALVEFALVLPILLLMIFGIVDAGRLIYTYNTVSNAARDGARVAIVNQSTSGTDTCDTTSATAWPTGCAIVSGLELGLTAADVSVTYQDATDSAVCSDPNNPGQLLIGCLAVVQVTGSFTPITPVIGQIIGQVSLSSTTKIPIERVCSNPPPSPLVNC
jgi:Flp pilus assembly protein TadG